MGTPSCMINERLEIREGKEAELKEWLKITESQYKDSVSVSDGEVHIELDDCKVIQYWYTEMLDFFDELAKYVDGYVDFNSDGWEEYASVVFGDGKVNIRLKCMEYVDHTTDDLRENHKESMDSINKLMGSE